MFFFDKSAILFLFFFFPFWPDMFLFIAIVKVLAPNTVLCQTPVITLWHTWKFVEATNNIDDVHLLQRIRESPDPLCPQYSHKAASKVSVLNLLTVFRAKKLHCADPGNANFVITILWISISSRLKAYFTQQENLGAYKDKLCLCDRSFFWQNCLEYRPFSL